MWEDTRALNSLNAKVWRETRWLVLFDRVWSGEVVKKGGVVTEVTTGRSRALSGTRNKTTPGTGWYRGRYQRRTPRQQDCRNRVHCTRCPDGGRPRGGEGVARVRGGGGA